jgi:hypothetical protein
MIKRVAKIIIFITIISIFFSNENFNTIQIPTAQSAGPHDYFNSLISRSDFWRGYSLRDNALLTTSVSGGGYASCNSCTKAITYNPATDPDPNRQDAAKVVIPAFTSGFGTSLASAIDSSQTVIPFTYLDGNYVRGRGIKIDNEIVTVNSTDLTAKTATVNRGVGGTTATSHASGTGAKASINSTESQIYLPLFTTDGNTYLFTWDGLWTDSYLNNGIINHKTFQFTSGSNNDSGGLWLEPNTNFSSASSLQSCVGYNNSTMVAGISARSYNGTGGGADWSTTAGNLTGPGVTNTEPLQSSINPRQPFCVYPNKWVRFWVRIDQRASDYDYMDMWVADETQNPVQVYKNIPISVRPYGSPVNSIRKFWLEYNTSSDEFLRGNGRDFVAYVRNFASLINPPSDLSSLLVKPVGGGLSGNIPPSVSLTSPSSGQSFAAPATVNFAASASDADGSVSKVEFYNGSTLLSTDTSAPYTFSWSNVAGGNYTVSARAYDNAGTTASASASISVTSGTTPPPPPSSGTDMSISANPTTVSSGGSATLSYSWNAATRHNVRLNGAAPAATCDTSTCAGSMVINLSATTTYTMTAVYADGTTAPPASATVTVGATATLVGDLNGDKIVNSIDWSIMNSKWFTSDATADLNKDGLVNSLDWSLLNQNWFKTG